MNCACISYNRPQPYQSAPSAVLQVPEWAPRGDNGDTICVDACIAPVIQALWAEKVWTLGCCCGHNGDFDRNVIVHECDRAKAERIIAGIGDTANVGAWVLVWSKESGGKRE